MNVVCFLLGDSPASDLYTPKENTQHSEHGESLKSRIYETQNLLSLLFVSFLVGLRTYQHPCVLLSAPLILMSAR